jgi:hypothetical protein
MEIVFDSFPIQYFFPRLFDVTTLSRKLKRIGLLLYIHIYAFMSKNNLSESIVSTTHFEQSDVKESVFSQNSQNKVTVKAPLILKKC